jgi:hypothetical protein
MRRLSCISGVLLLAAGIAEVQDPAPPPPPTRRPLVKRPRASRPLASWESCPVSDTSTLCAPLRDQVTLEQPARG